MFITNERVHCGNRAHTLSYVCYLPPGTFWRRNFHRDQGCWPFSTIRIERETTMFLAAQPRSHDVTNLAIIIRCCLLPSTISTSECFRELLLISKNWNIARVGILYRALLRRTCSLCTRDVFLNCIYDSVKGVQTFFATWDCWRW